MLLVLAATNWGSEIKGLDTIFLAKSKNKVVFSLEKFRKPSKPGKRPPDVIFYSFPGNEDLFPVKTPGFYLKVSEPWRRKGDRSQLLFSLVKPHKPISSATLARWIKEMLKFSVINTDIFKAHLVRSASASKAKFLGFTTKDILRKVTGQGNLLAKGFITKKLGARNKYFKNQYSKRARFELRPELDRV